MTIGAAVGPETFAFGPENGPGIERKRPRGELHTPGAVFYLCPFRSVERVARKRPRPPSVPNNNSNPT